jgi:FkbM family methyltransferase
VYQERRLAFLIYTAYGSLGRQKVVLATHPRLKSAVMRAVRHPTIVVPIARGLELAGVRHLGRSLLALNGAQIPRLVTVTLPSNLFHERTMTMVTANGRDTLATGLWSKGWDRYERPLPMFWAASIKDGDVVVDVGSNTGFYALLAASVGSDVEVHAFEPNPQVFELLTTNLAHNPQGTRVRPVQMAADNVPGHAELFIPQEGERGIIGDASLNKDFRSIWANSVTVSKTTLDEYTMHLPHVDVIKIDVECLEERVIEGAQETLRHRRPIIFYEVLDCDDCHADCAAIDAIRRQVDYVSVQLNPNSGVLREAVAYNEPWRNQALWPSEKLGMLQKVSQRLHYHLH